jgi:hypothetical protein
MFRSELATVRKDWDGERRWGFGGEVRSASSQASICATYGASTGRAVELARWFPVDSRGILR